MTLHTDTDTLPDGVRSELETHLADGETVVAVIRQNETPLIRRIMPWWVLTDRRLLSFYTFSWMHDTTEIRLNGVKSVKFQSGLLLQGRLTITGPGIATKESLVNDDAEEFVRLIRKNIPE